MKKIFLLFLSLFLLSGCQLLTSYKDAAILKAGYQKKSEVEGIIAQIKKEYALKEEENDKRNQLAQDAIVTELNNKLTFIGGKLYGADLPYQFLLHPDRTHMIMDNKINEARQVANQPTVADMVKENAEVKRLLDETITSLDQLKVTHEAAMKEADIVNQKAIKAQQELDAAKKEKESIEKEKNKALTEKQEALNKINDEVIAKEHARSDEEKARQALLSKLSVGAGLLSAACIAGAIFSPLLKLQFGLTGGIFAIAAVGIWYLTPLVVGCVVGGVILLAIGWAALNHNKEASSATDTYRALQRIKDKSPEEYEKLIKPELEEANMKYVTKDGVITKVPDASREAFIDKRLAQVGDK